MSRRSTSGSGLDPKASLAAEINRLKETYARALPDRLATLEALWHDVRAGDRRPDELEPLYRAAHSLTGSGATFGYERVSVSARALELYLQPLITGASVLTQTHVDKISELLDALTRAAETSG